MLLHYWQARQSSGVLGEMMIDGSVGVCHWCGCGATKPYAKDESAKQMGERIRSGEATAEEYFEMGSIMLRKKVFTQAVRNLKLAAQMWEGDQEDLAQIHNALGFGYLSTDKLDEAVVEFNKAGEMGGRGHGREGRWERETHPTAFQSSQSIINALLMAERRLW